MLIRFLLILVAALGLTPGVFVLPALQASSAVSPSTRMAVPQDFTVEFFPVAPHYLGEQISVRVTYSGQEQIAGREIAIALAENPGDVLETTRFSGGSQQAIFYWILDTGGRQPGFVNFTFSIPEMNLSWQSGLNLLPAPDGGPQNWAEVHTECCRIHYLPGTDAAEDIDQIQHILEQQTSEALAQFASIIAPDQTTLQEPLPLVLIPSLIGQGGFATEIAVITYSHRNWAGTSFDNIVHHEIVHVLDRQWNTGYRPSLFVEGLAVYFAGGHYQAWDPLQRAAALLAAGRYIPITDFVDDFYAAQHEISYIEAGGLVAFLVEIWGLESFLDFYFGLPDADSDSASISSALEEQFGLTLAELEEAYLTHLQSLDPPITMQDNVLLTIETYDLMRRYQKIRVPSAYFRNAWWPPMDRVLEMDIVGDYAPREKTPVDIVIENLFLDIYPALNVGDLRTAEANLAEIGRLLDLAEDQRLGFSHYSIGWPLPHPHLSSP